jgi:hypothetical protein
MRPAATIAALLVSALAVSSCGEEGPTARLTLVANEGVRQVTVPAWKLPPSGRIVGLGGAPGGDPRVAQSHRVSRLTGDGSAETDFATPAGARVVALSSRGGRIAVADREGLRAGRVDSFDPDSTALSSYSQLTRPLVLDSFPARLFDGALWDLDVPRRVWFPQVYGDSAAVDPTLRRLAIGDEEGEVTVISARNGEEVENVPRASGGDWAAEISAVAISADGGVATLDRAGWVGCGRAGVPALPLAPPGMPSAIARAGDRIWVLRGGIAVMVDCTPVPRTVCRVQGETGDPRSAALLRLDGHVYAAGLVGGSIVLLPRCR